MVASTGCLSSLATSADDTPTPSAEERCADRRFPDRHLGVVRLEESGPPADADAVIRFGELTAGEREVVAHAIEHGRYEICLPAAPDERVEAFDSLIERIDGHTRSVEAGAYLERDGTYHRFTHVRRRDQVWITARS